MPPVSAPQVPAPPPPDDATSGMTQARINSVLYGNPNCLQDLSVP